MTRTLPARRQLALGVQLRDDATFGNFLVPAKAGAAFRAVQALGGTSGSALLYLHGAGESGKTHLLQAACHAAAAAIYLPLAQLRDADPAAVVEGAQSLQLVCLDDLQAVAGDRAWETALFNLCNLAREAGCNLLLAADAPVRRLPLLLEDLRSRLAWGTVFHLPRPDDERRVAVLRLRASRRGLSLSESTAQYMVARAPRDLGHLLGLLDDLDSHSLAEKRALTVPFVKRALGW